MNTSDLEATSQYLRVANYLTAAKRFLRHDTLPMMVPAIKSNKHLLDMADIAQPLTPEQSHQLSNDFTANIIYTQLSNLAYKHQANFQIITEKTYQTAIQTNIFLQQELDEQTSQTPFVDRVSGFLKVKNLASTVLYGHQHTGGAVSLAYGAVLGAPKRTVFCLTTSSSVDTYAPWQLHKLLQLDRDGQVVPIIQLQQASTLGNINDYELQALFIGYGYEPKLVDLTNSKTTEAQATLIQSLDWAYSLANATKEKHQRHVPRPPILLLRAVHQPLVDIVTPVISAVEPAKNQSNEDIYRTVKRLTSLFDWCNFFDLYDNVQGFGPWLSKVVDSDHRVRPLLARPVTTSTPKLSLPHIEDHTAIATPPGSKQYAPLQGVQTYLQDLCNHNSTLQQFFVITDHKSNWLSKNTNKTSTNHQKYVTVTYPLSVINGLLRGYESHNGQSIYIGDSGTTTSFDAAVKDYSLYTQSYKVPAQAIHANYPKSKRVPSSNNLQSSRNYIIQTIARQPLRYLDSLLRQPDSPTNIYLPADNNCAVVAMELMLTSRQQFNVLCVSNDPQPNWLTTKTARAQITAGLAIWNFASHPNPNIVLAAAGDEATKELMAAIHIITQQCPAAQIRCVNISSLTPIGFGTTQQPVSQRIFEQIFTTDKPVVVNFAGYSHTIAAIFGRYTIDTGRLSICDSSQTSSNTTAAPTYTRHCSNRHNIALAAFAQLGRTGVISITEAQRLAAEQAKYALK